MRFREFNPKLLSLKTNKFRPVETNGLFESLNIYGSLVALRHAKKVPFIKRVLSRVKRLRLKFGRLRRRSFQNRVLSNLSSFDRLRRGRAVKKYRSLFSYRLFYRNYLLSQRFRSFGAKVFNRSCRVFVRLAPVVRPSTVVADTVRNYALYRLRRYHLPSDIFSSLIRSLETDFYSFSMMHKPVRGLLAVCSGRFTRQQMASLVRFRTGAVSSSTIESPMDYGFGSVALKYGAVGIKIYLTQSR